MNAVQNSIKKGMIVGSYLATSLMFAGAVFAQGEPVGLSDPSPGSAFPIQDIGGVFSGLFNAVLFISAILVFGYLIWGGVQWITSGGDKGKTEEARNKITAAIIGLVVVAISYAVFRVVLYVIGINDPFTDTQGALDQIRFNQQ